MRVHTRMRMCTSTHVHSHNDSTRMRAHVHTQMCTCVSISSMCSTHSTRTRTRARARACLDTRAVGHCQQSRGEYICTCSKGAHVLERHPYTMQEMEQTPATSTKNMQSLRTLRMCTLECMVRVRTLACMHKRTCVYECVCACTRAFRWRSERGRHADM